MLRYDTFGTDPDFDNASLWRPFEPGASCVGARNGGYLGGVFDGRHVYLSPYYDGNSHGEVVRFDTMAEDQAADCNGNGIPDECDIASGTSLDTNMNGVPDECDPVTSDVSDLTAYPAAGRVQLTWTASPDATGYKVYIDDGGGFDAGTDIGDTTQYDATGLTNGLRYLFEVTAYSPRGPRQPRRAALCDAV